nr:uncharacterized protein CTRU02_08587 [Colletotrichum truncatum]KAF6789888.1 hypothetical protein CTRU02_08587 [Colletotrichum truncatum]
MNNQHQKPARKIRQKRPRFEQAVHDGTVNDDDDEGEGPPRPRPKSNYKSLYKWWNDEYRLVAVCVAGAIALGIVFQQFDNQLVPKLPGGIDFDVVIVAMFTCVRVAMSGIVESSISQAAWIWVSEARQRRTNDMRAKLEDFKIYDEASRGLHLACIGAMIVVLVHGLEASSQQLYQYEGQPWEVNDGEKPPIVAPPRSDFWDYTVSRGIDPLPVLNVSTKAAVYSGILSVDVTELDVECSAVNCTWPIIPTLAVCGECNTISVDTMCTDKSQMCLYRMSSGTSLDVAQNAASAERFRVTASPGTHHHVNSTDHTYISVFDVLWVLKNRKEANIIGQECALWFCMKSYNITVTESRLNQALRETWSKMRFEDGNTAHDNEYVFVDIPASMNVAGESRYSVTHQALMALRRFVDPLVEGTYEKQNTIINFSSEWAEGVYNARRNLPAWIRRFSISLTNEVRLHGKVRDKQRHRYSGRAYKIAQVIRVDWKWLIFPTGLIVVSIYYLFHTIIKGARDGVSVWKSDSLPMLFCRIDPSILSQVGDGMDLPNGLDERVGNIKVCLLREDDGDWVFKPIESEESSSESESSD